MRALLLDRLPNLAIAAKEDPDRPLNGVKVNDAALVQALLKYGSYDAYYYIRESAQNSKAEAYENGDRLQPLDLGSLERLRYRGPDEFVLFTSSHHLAKYVPFRQFCGHTEWPICGITHGLSSNTLIPSYSWNYFSAIKSYDAIICTSAAGKRALHNLFDGLCKSRSVAGVRGFFPPRMPMIPLGIEPMGATGSWHGAGESKGHAFVVLCLGRLTASHKADLRPLIAAFLCDQHLPSDATLLIAGDDTQGHIAASLEDFARQFSSTRTIVLLPNVAESMKGALLSTADVAICMSDTYQETFGLSLLEAMAAGLPVIAPDWDGYRDIVQHGETGYLVPTSTCPDTGFLNAVSMLIDPAYVLGQRTMIDLDAIMLRLRALSSDRRRAKEMGALGRARVEAHFTWQSVIERYEALWDKLIRKGRSLRRASTCEEFGFMDYDKVFAGHPSSTLSAESAVTANLDSNTRLALLNSGVLFSPPPVAGFSEALDQRIVDACRSRREWTFGALVEELSEPLMGRSMVIAQVCRLAKYGVLSVFPWQIEAKQTQEMTYEDTADPALRPVGV